MSPETIVHQCPLKDLTILMHKADLSHMTGNRSYLTDYEEDDGGFVYIGGAYSKEVNYSPILCKIQKILLDVDANKQGRRKKGCEDSRKKNSEVPNDDEDVGVEADMNNLDAFMPTWLCLLLSQEEPKKDLQALKDPVRSNYA
ncbi:hypothetical protein Tco_1525034 [Tanacetum coccineum]